MIKNIYMQPYVFGPIAISNHDGRYGAARRTDQHSLAGKAKPQVLSCVRNSPWSASGSHKIKNLGYVAILPVLLYDSALLTISGISIS